MGNTNEKVALKYRVNNGHNPKTGETIRRPFIVDSEKYSIERVVQYALENSYMTGQYESCLGQAKGFLEAIKKIASMGKVVDIASWFRVRAYLTGTVGESEALTSANEYKVRIQTLNELKLDKSNFSFSNEGQSTKASIASICTKGGSVAGQWEKDKPAIAGGSNLFFKADDGDTIVATYMVSGEEKTVSMIANDSSYNFIQIAYPEEFAELGEGTEVKLTFTLHGGDKEAAPKVITKAVKIVEAA